MSRPPNQSEVNQPPLFPDSQERSLQIRDPGQATQHRSQAKPQHTTTIFGPIVPSRDMTRSGVHRTGHVTKMYNRVGGGLDLGLGFGAWAWDLDLDVVGLGLGFESWPGTWIRKVWDPEQKKSSLLFQKKNQPPLDCGSNSLLFFLHPT